MASVLSRGNASFAKWLTYVLTEIMRNIPERDYEKKDLLTN